MWHYILGFVGVAILNEYKRSSLWLIASTFGIPWFSRFHSKIDPILFKISRQFVLLFSPWIRSTEMQVGAWSWQRAKTCKVRIQPDRHKKRGGTWGLTPHRLRISSLGRDPWWRVACRRFTGKHLKRKSVGKWLEAEVSKERGWLIINLQRRCQKNPHGVLRLDWPFGTVPQWFMVSGPSGNELWAVGSSYCGDIGTECFYPEEGSGQSTIVSTTLSLEVSSQRGRGNQKACRTMNFKCGDVNFWMNDESQIVLPQGWWNAKVWEEER